MQTIYRASECTHVVKNTDSGIVEYYRQDYEKREVVCLSVVPHGNGKEFMIYERTIFHGNSMSRIIGGCSFCHKNNFKEGLYGGYVCLSCSAPFNVQ
jgi:hypothetical protein